MDKFGVTRGQNLKVFGISCINFSSLQEKNGLQVYNYNLIFIF